MALENWVDKQDGIDDILAEDINSIANAAIETQEKINKIVIDQTYSPGSENAQSGKAVAEAVSDKQDSLVSGTNIKTINNQSILGSGNITIEGGSDVEVDQIYSPTSENAQSGKAVAEAVATEQKRADNTFANALKGSKSGSAILIDDISPVEHTMTVKVSSDTVTDLTAVKVRKCGKNLLDTNQAHNAGWSGNRYDTFSINDNVITATSDNSTTKTVSMGLFDGELPAGDYILSLNAVIENTPKHKRPNEIFISKNGSVLTLTSVTKTDGSYSPKIKFTLSEKAKIIIDFHKNVNASQETVSDTVYKVTLSNIQLELGSTATDYEPYKECAEYTPNADGTVNGVTSLYPNTTLMSDKDGVLIDCEYNRDINKAFAALEAAIATNNS